jgi:hypothetical protein
MKLKTLGLLALILFIASCKNSFKEKGSEQQGVANLSSEKDLFSVLQDLNLSCTKFLYLYTTYTIQAEKDRFRFLLDSIKPGIGGPNLIEEIENHLERIESAQKYFNSLPPALGFYTLKINAAYVQKVKPPCPCPSPSDTTTCVCKASAIIVYDEGGTRIESASLNDEDIFFIKEDYMSISKTRIFRMKNEISIHHGDTLKLNMRIAYRDSTNKLNKATLGHTQIMRITR